MATSYSSYFEHMKKKLTLSSFNELFQMFKVDESCLLGLFKLLNDSQLEIASNIDTEDEATLEILKDLSAVLISNIYKVKGKNSMQIRIYKESMKALKSISQIHAVVKMEIKSIQADFQNSLVTSIEESLFPKEMEMEQKDELNGDLLLEIQKFESFLDIFDKKAFYAENQSLFELLSWTLTKLGDMMIEKFEYFDRSSIKSTDILISFISQVVKSNVNVQREDDSEIQTKFELYLEFLLKFYRASYKNEFL